MTQRELIDEEIAVLFEVIFNRIKRYDLEVIMEKNKDSWHASMNLSTSSQLEAQKEFRNAVHEGIKNIIDHDMNTIIKVLKESELFTKVLDDNN